jgi:hypothetical protein
MDILTAIEKKCELEDSIHLLLAKFEIETNLQIEDIDLLHTHNIGEKTKKVRVVTVEVSL